MFNDQRFQEEGTSVVLERQLALLKNAHYLRALFFSRTEALRVEKQAPGFPGARVGGGWPFDNSWLVAFLSLPSRNRWRTLGGSTLSLLSILQRALGGPSSKKSVLIYGGHFHEMEREREREDDKEKDHEEACACLVLCFLALGVAVGGSEHPMQRTCGSKRYVGIVLRPKGGEFDIMEYANDEDGARGRARDVGVKLCKSSGLYRGEAGAMRASAWQLHLFLVNQDCTLRCMSPETAIYHLGVEEKVLYIG